MLVYGTVSANNAQMSEPGGGMMNIKLISEIGATMLLGVIVFAWVFGQSPNTVQTRSTKSAKQQIANKQAGQRGDKFPAVVQQASRQLPVNIGPIALQAPGQALGSTESLYEVVANNLKMRSGPSSASQLVNVYSRGATFEKIGQQGNWLQVRSTENGVSGWMFSNYLQAAN